MKKVQAGFTLIELVVVIVILGILAAVALPKFVDLSGEASQAAVDGVAGSVASAASINYAARLATKGQTPQKGSAVSTCDNALALVTGLNAADYSIAVKAPATEPIADGAATDCEVTGKNGKTAIASVIGAS